MRIWIVVAGAALALAGCAAPKPEAAPAAVAAPAAPAKPAPAAATRPVQPQAVDRDALDMARLRDSRDILARRSVYFDLDSYTVGPPFVSLVQAHGQFLARHARIKILVQGNADERGSAEYNLALGDKRAAAVKRGLIAAGASEAQVEAVSFGKEKPRATGHDENAWTLNRRADLAYP